MNKATSSVMIALCVLAAGLASAPCVTAEQYAPQSPPDIQIADASAHRSGFVTVQGVRIHFLDWGGSGPGLVFIPGFGNSAHVFDDFASRFLARYRVVAITRVGFGESAQPDGNGYELDARVAHISAVLDSLDIEKAILVGHSLGGDEITALASVRPERTIGLVYLDAAYDHVEALKKEQSLAPLFAGAPQPTAVDLGNARSYRAYFRRLRGFELPLGEVLATMRFDSTGAVRGQITQPHVVEALMRETKPLDYSKVRSPALAIYSDWEGAADVLPFLRDDPAAESEATVKMREILGTWQEDERARLARELKGARVTSFRSSHYQFLSDPDETERLMRAFLVQLSGRQ